MIAPGTLCIIVRGKLYQRTTEIPTPSSICSVHAVPSVVEGYVCDILFQNGTLASCRAWHYLRPLTPPRTNAPVARNRETQA